MKKTLTVCLLIFGLLISWIGLAIAEPLLTFTQIVIPSTAMQSDEITYTITISNNSSENVNNVYLFDLLPQEDITFVSWIEKPAGVSRLGNAFSWVGTVFARQVIVFNFVARYIGNGGDVNNTAMRNICGCCNLSRYWIYLNILASCTVYYSISYSNPYNYSIAPNP